jgi:molybdenum cofactor guanylyltransferase
MPAMTTTCGGIVLCGGQSRRMGRAKALLPIGNEVLVERVVRILGQVVSPIVVVAAQGQELPEFPLGVLVARDEYEALGPLAGLAAGLKVLSEFVEAAYVSSCDAPLLKPAWVRRMIELLETAGPETDLVIPRDGKYHHPLAAVYRTRIEPTVRALIEEGQLRPYFLLERVRAREIDVAALRDVDPDLSSLRNTNTPEEYALALRDAGFPVQNDAGAT